MKDKLVMDNLVKELEGIMLEVLYINSEDTTDSEDQYLAKISARAIAKHLKENGLVRLDGIDVEPLSEAVHKAYCKYHIEHKGEEYWTKGDYNKLNEEGKEYDRRTVKAVLSQAIVVVARLNAELKWCHDLIHKYHDNRTCPDLKTYVENLQKEVAKLKARIKELEK